jgi:D-glucuronyl C5-epimerase C-terminus
VDYGRGYTLPRIQGLGRNQYESGRFASQMSAVPRILVALLLGAAALAAPASASEVLEYRDGRLIPRESPHLPPPSGPEAALGGKEQECADPSAVPDVRPAPKVSAAGAGVGRAIGAARRRGTITRKEAGRYRRIYRAAIRTRGRLGRWRGELASVISTLRGIAARGSLTGGRMPALFLQLRRNKQFWSGDPEFPPRPDIEPEPCEPGGSSGPAGSRISFPGSRMVFQYYPGSGLQIQPLANFGMANGMVTECRREPENCDRDGLRQLLAELIEIRSSRGGFITWEYWFHFGGGSPPWTSGMSQGTAIQALTRASEPSILNDTSYLGVAAEALGAFRKRAPVGVRVQSGRGSHYLLYSFDPGLRVLNGFLQAITGLYDYARIADSPEARKLMRAGNRAAKEELRRFDTGAWSLYSQGGAEASGGYHSLVTTFLGNLCQRLEGRYCVYRDRFRGYSATPPEIRYTGRRSVGAGSTLSLSYTVDKVSCVTARVKDAAGRRVHRARLKVARGSHAFAWRPSRRGKHTLALEARDLLGNKRVVRRTITVR